MLKKILVVSLTVFALASCSKDKDTPAYSLSAKIDGANQNFNSGLTALKESGGQAITIAGVAGSTSGFNIDIDGDGAPVSAKTYTAANGEIFAVYMASPTSMFASDDDFSVTITSINDVEVRGTFSGKVENGTTVKNITEGSFTAKFQ